VGGGKSLEETHYLYGPWMVMLNSMCKHQLIDPSGCSATAHAVIIIII